MKEVKELIKISNFLSRLAISLFILFWGEIIFMFTKFPTPGQLLYREYGTNGMTFYFALIFALIIIILRQSTKIDTLANQIANNNIDLK